MSDNVELERRFPRRFLLASTGAVAAGGAMSALSAPAGAAAGSTAWKLGGNSGVSSDGSNFLGPTNVAPLVFKTRASGEGNPKERMRILSTGRVAVGTTVPAAQLHVVNAANSVVAILGTSKDTTVNATGVQGASASGAGVRGNSTQNYGVYGTGGFCGLRGQGGTYGSISAGETGVYGSGTQYGVYGVGGPYGVYGNGSSSGVVGSGNNGVHGTGVTYGVYGRTTNPNSDAVRGDGGQWGCRGVNGRTAGVRGDSGYVGVWGEAPTYGLYAVATATSGTTYGVFGDCRSSGGWAVYAQGNCRVTGTLQKGAGSFLIDHPLDPDNKWLSHSFVESPDMMNVYNGNVVLDAKGEATVTLPHYFQALNRDFRYQLTTIGGFAPVYVAQEIKGNRFRIAGGTAGLKVSWQVTGVRQDDYAKAHPIVVETAKTPAERGTRLFAAAARSKEAVTSAAPSDS